MFMRIDRSDSAAIIFILLYVTYQLLNGTWLASIKSSLNLLLLACLSQH